MSRRDRIAEVIREYIHERDHADLPPTPGEIADRLMPWMQPAGNVHEWLRMARQVDAVRRLADALDHEAYLERTGALLDSDTQYGAGLESAADRIREVLADSAPGRPEGVARAFCALCDGTGSYPDADSACGNCLGYGEVLYIPVPIQRKDG